MTSDAVTKTVGKKLRYYFEVKRLEDGFDLSGVNAPQLNHPPLKSRPTLQYDGLHDRALKHYFSQPEVRTKITQLLPNDPHDPKEDYKKKLINRYMYKHRFIQNSDPLLDLSILKPKRIVGFHLNIDKLKEDPRDKRRYAWQSNTPTNNKKHPTMPQWMYRHHPTEGTAIKNEYVGFGVGLKKRRKSIKGGYPLLRSVPSHKVTKGEAHRLIDVATKILVATEKVNELQSRPSTPAPKRQTAPQPFETNKPLPNHDGKKKKRPSTAKYTWDIHGRRHVKVKDRDTHSDDGHKSREKRRAYDDSFIPDWLLKQDKKSPPHSPERSPSRSRTPSPKPSPRPKSAKYRQRDQPTVINVPETRDREEVRVNEGTQTADTVGIQTERRLLEEYDKDEDEVTSGTWDEYQLYVRTGDRVGASTKADVRVTLYGEKGRTREITLDKSSRNKILFQRAKEDVFLVAAPNVGKLRKIKIGHDRPELAFAWYLDSVSVYDMNDKKIYDFPCQSWVSGQYGDRKTYKFLDLDQFRSFVDTYDDVRNSKSPQVGRDRKAKTTSTESRHSKDDKRSVDSVRGSKGEHYHSDSDTSTSSLSTTSSSSGSRRGRKNTTAPRAKTPTKIVREASPARQPAKDDLFDSKAGPTFTFKSFTEDGKTAEEEYMTGYKAGLDAAATDQKHKEDEEDAEMKRILSGPSIHDAARAGNMERMQTLVSHYPELKEAKDESGLTPLHIATQQGRLEIVKWLTALGINLNTETRTGYTAIHLAAMNGHLNCLIVLFAMGATLTCRSVDRQTPLHVASMNGHLECVKWLIANRSSMDAEDQLGRTPLDLAEEYQHKPVADFIRKCIEESHDPSSSLHALRSSRKGLGTIEEDRNKESPRNDGRWLNDTNPDSARANAGSDSEGRNMRKESHDSTYHLQERRRVYEKQHHQMEETGTSFLDSIRDEATH